MNVKETFGEHLSDGSLIEYIYDPELCRAMLAIAGPDEEFKAQIREDMLEFAGEKVGQ